jgi:hypothetical protein
MPVCLSRAPDLERYGEQNRDETGRNGVTRCFRRQLAAACGRRRAQAEIG